MTSNHGILDREAHLDEIVAAFLEQVEQGTPVDRAEWLRRHPEFEAELEQFFADSDRLASVLKPLNGPERPAFMPKTPGRGERFGDYEILAEVARGGMGVVFTARQLSLQRVVALKMILSGRLASAEELQRFRLEAEMVAHLDHPHIVPVYEVGEQGGWHFYSMKYIEGGNLADLKLARPLSRAEQVRVAKLVATVAAAVSHAHQHGMLHRDLKPANILLDRDGQPHVTDFGLAKRLPSDAVRSAVDHATPTGTALGTPSYMAPEQALGRKDATTAADIYSLGCILYELLTGRPPFRAETPLATLLDVLESTPDRPSSLCPTLDRDLETVCLKCLEREPNKRYASAADLADDLKRFIDGVPVQARSPGRGERCVRWCRREPLLASALGGLIVLFCTAFVLITWQWQRAETNYETGQGHLEDARTEKAEAQRQAGLAEEQRLRAEKQLEEAEELADKYLIGMSENRLNSIPGTQGVRRDLLEASQKYLQSFLAQRRDDPKLRRKLAGAHYSLGVVLDTLGKQSEALREFQQSSELYKELMRSEPDNVSMQKSLAQAVERTGIMLGTVQRQDALESYREAYDLYKKLADQYPRDQSVQANFAKMTCQIGLHYRVQGEPEIAREYLARGLEIHQRILSWNPKDPALKNSVAIDTSNYAAALHDLGQRKESMEYYTKAREQFEALVAAYPGDLSYLRALGMALTNIGDLERTSGAVEKSIATLTRARAMYEKIVSVNPQVVQFQKDLATCERYFGHAHKALGKKSDALACYMKSRDLLEKIVQLEPASAEALNHLAKSHFDIAVTLDSSRKKERSDAFDRARLLREEVVRLCPDTAIYRHDLALTLGNLAIDHWNRNNKEKAMEMADRALAEGKEARKLRPRHVAYRNTMAGHLGLRGLFFWNTGRPDEALADFQARADLVQGDAAELYETARHMGEHLLNSKLGGAAPDAQRRSADLTVNVLRRAVAAGYRNSKALAEDNAFVTLRERADFKEVLASVKAP